MEQWKEVVGFEDAYAVSSLGRIMRTRASKGTRPGKILRPGLTKDKSHQLVVLRRDGQSFTRTVHRLVADAFIPRPADPHAYMVAHKDGNGCNNDVTNLYWATPSQNNRDQVLHGTAKGTYHPEREALAETDVRAIRADGRSAREIAKAYRLHPSTVTQIRRRETHKHVPANAKDYVSTLKKFNFTPETVRSIRADSRSVSAIAKSLSVSSQTIWAIRKRVTYAWVD